MDTELLFGRADPSITAVEVTQENPSRAICYRRREGALYTEEDAFRPFLWLASKELLKGFEGDIDVHTLSGKHPLKHLVSCSCWKELQQLLKHIKKNSRVSTADPGAPFFCLRDEVQQYLIQSGRTLFKEMNFADLHRMQLDIETRTSEGYEFPNAERPEDEIIMIALSDNRGWSRLLSRSTLSEKELLISLVEWVKERDPDCIEGHNIFNFDLSYIQTRARQHKVKLSLGRDGSEVKRRASRFSVAERSQSYTRYDIHGRHIIDTYFLAQLYDVSTRDLPGYGLKEVARYFGVSSDDRVYIDGASVTATFDKDPQRVERYARHDVEETAAISEILSPVYFTQSQMLPYSYQNTCLRGNAAKIDALMIREYYRRDASLPLPSAGRSFAGGYTDLFETGVEENVHHCDIQSLYPSLMLNHALAPESDELNVFLEMLRYLRNFRLEAKNKMKQARHEAERIHQHALQSTYKILINSFYGYLGFGQARFNDFDAADRIAAEGRKLLAAMIEWIREEGGRPIEIDTDGVYFVPPPGPEAGLEPFRERIKKRLPEGIDVDFDGQFKAMFSYKMKNYALLDHDGRVLIKGASLKSRGLEPFQRDFMEQLMRLLLEQKRDDIQALYQQYKKAIMEREWPVQRLAKTETLQDSPATYASRIKEKKRGRNAAYELALKSAREYRAGDQITYYVTGTDKSVSVYASAKMIHEWDPQNRDENRVYYAAKLETLYNKFKEWIAPRDELELF